MESEERIYKGMSCTICDAKRNRYFYNVNEEMSNKLVI